MIGRLIKIIAVLDRVHFVMDGGGDHTWAYRMDTFEKAHKKLMQLGDHKSAEIMVRLRKREWGSKSRWRLKELV